MRRLLGTLVAASALLAATATAGAAVYEGHVRGAPESQFNVTVKKTDGKRYVTFVSFSTLPVTCQNGPNYLLSGSIPYDDGNRVRRDGAFDVRTEDPPSGPLSHSHLVGKLKRRGRAAGTFENLVEFPLSPEGICVTVGVEWVAKKA